MRSALSMHAALERTLVAAGGNVRRAAQDLGCPVPTLYKRLRRCGISPAVVRYQLTGPPAARPDVSVQSPPIGDAVLTPAGVTLALADYAVLQARAAEGYEVPILRGQLETAERIVATLTAHVERLAVSA